MEGGERKETVHEEMPTEEQTTTGPEDTATGQEGPKELERHHVPGGTWLSQRKAVASQKAEKLYVLKQKSEMRAVKMIAVALGAFGVVKMATAT
ncbi:hypothetical protein NDU88_006172 [Pleurodeles waltl]|uniref:Uncharacterized protein n=1 Tax=Pleurodeles waltl TaxID=8319 RepID=A0AAV7WZ96_PLEWA|nr:hypothetical protein NDU88_006172 [Pleurodeles waltl]